MKFGVAFIPGFPAEQTMGLAEEAERQGYDYLFIPDQTFHRDPFTLLGLCAHATETIQLGLGVTNPYSRHPVQIARAAGTLADVSGGRFVLGLGAGNGPTVLGGLGLSHEKVIGRLREATDVIRRLLRGETVDYHSPTLTVNSVRLDFDVAPPVPIFLASRNPGMLSLAGAVADGVMFESLPTEPALHYALGQVSAGAARADRSVRDLVTASWQMLFLEDDPAISQRADVLRWASAIIASTRPEVLRTLDIEAPQLRGPGRSGPPQAASPEDALKLFTMGSSAAVIRQISTICAAGIELYTGVVHGDAAAVRDTMRRFAAEVMPAFAKSEPAPGTDPGAS
jgi:5,10-methylenetetrahydromethanopterin reductase